ncbi:hypothetical protein ABZY58_12175 [Micromonospora tulbaghiae]|uniref:hypothetical protein n=1 Tax=Micromonospora tulbaghiae TaxID=479978 RepID=UPI00339E2A69
MSDVLRTDAGTATPLLSGGYLCDFGDAVPTFAPNREKARDLLDARAAARHTQIRPAQNPAHPGTN